mgnify:CR=1 FL=1
MKLKSLIPYYGEYKTRRQIDKLFSRQMLGSVLVGKFIGDYTAIMFTRYLGTDIGYSSGILITISVFIYWEQLSAKAEEAKEAVEEAADSE